MSSPFNATITADAIGTYKLRCIWIKHGVHIISDEAEGANRRVFYPSVTTSSGFGMQVAFPSYASRSRFTEWLRDYFERTVAGRGFRAPVHVDVPSRKFSRTCIPHGSDTPMYGEGVTDVGYTMDLGFTGSSDPLEIGPQNRGVFSFFRLPGKDVKHAKNYYPGGIQLSGADLLDTTLFDGWEVSQARPVNEDEYSTDPNAGGG